MAGPETRRRRHIAVCEPALAPSCLCRWLRLAAYGVMLRITQYGLDAGADYGRSSASWSPACLTRSATFFATLHSIASMAWLEPTNIFTSLIIVGALLAPAHQPVADPGEDLRGGSVEPAGKPETVTPERFRFRLFCATGQGR